MCIRDRPITSPSCILTVLSLRYPNKMRSLDPRVFCTSSIGRCNNSRFLIVNCKLFKSVTEDTQINLYDSLTLFLIVSHFLWILFSSLLQLWFLMVLSCKNDFTDNWLLLLASIRSARKTIVSFGPLFHLFFKLCPAYSTFLNENQFFAWHVKL